jgi:adenylate cyclase class IV
VIEFESVKDLGLFLEVEFCTDDDVDVATVKKEIQQFIDSLGLAVSKELNAGKPELMLRKQTVS